MLNGNSDKKSDPAVALRPRDSILVILEPNISTNTKPMRGGGVD
jgi:hypothetical protein